MDLTSFPFSLLPLHSRNHGRLIKASGLGIEPEVGTFDHTSSRGGNSIDDKVLRPLLTSNDLLRDKK